MKNRRNFYRILQVQPDAPTEVIRASYRTLMRELKQHPDLGGSTLEAAILNEAYKTLTDPKRRAAYDERTIPRYPRKSPPAGPPGPAAPSCPFCRRPLERKTRPGDNCPTCEVPLQSRRRTDPGQTGRRSMPRLKRSGQILYATSWPGETREARMVDLSLKGMRFICSEKINPGTILKINAPHLRASAVVVNLREEVDGDRPVYTIGTSFLAVDFEDPRGSFLSVSG